MRNAITVLFFTLFYGLTNAQVIKISEAIPLRTEVAYELIGKVKGQHLLFIDRETEFKIQAFDEDLKQIWDKEIELEKRRPEVLGLVGNSESFHLVYQHRWKGETIIKAHQYNASANLIDSATIKNFGSLIIAPDFQIIRSEDRSKVLIYKEEADGEIEAVSFNLNSMKPLWEKKFKPDNLILARDEYQILVDNTGRMHYVVIKNNFRSRNKEHQYEVFHFDGSTESIQKYHIPIEEKLTYDIYFEYDNLNKQLIAGGLYSEKNTAWSKGYFLLRVPQDDVNNYQLTYHEFKENVVQNFLEKDTPSKNKGIFDAEVKELVLRRDGGALMVIERVKVNQRSYGSGAAASYYSRSLGNVAGLTDHYYEHLLVISIHPDGTTHWDEVLRKKQYSQDDGGTYSSYFLQKTPGKLHFIFNDEIKEENTVSEYIIKGNGKSERNSVMSTDNQKLKLRFRAAIQTSSRAMLVPSERRNRLKLVKIEF